MPRKISPQLFPFLGKVQWVRRQKYVFLCIQHRKYHWHLFPIIHIKYSLKLSLSAKSVSYFSINTILNAREFLKLTSSLTPSHPSSVTPYTLVVLSHRCAGSFPYLQFKNSMVGLDFWSKSKSNNETADSYYSYIYNHWVS